MCMCRSEREKEREVLQSSNIPENMLFLDSVLSIFFRKESL